MSSWSDDVVIQYQLGRNKPVLIRPARGRLIRWLRVRMAIWILSKYIKFLERLEREARAAK